MAAHEMAVESKTARAPEAPYCGPVTVTVAADVTPVASVNDTEPPAVKETKGAPQRTREREYLLPSGVRMPAAGAGYAPATILTVLRATALP